MAKWRETWMLSAGRLLHTMSVQDYQGRAIPYYRRAGEAAMQVYANAEAVTAFQQAAALLEAGTPGQMQQEQRWKEAAAIYTALGDIFSLTGRPQEARQVYQNGMASVPAREYIWRARLLRKTASTWNLASDNPLDTFHVNARQTFQEAERILEQAETRSSREWQQEWIQLQLDQLFPLRGSVDEMTAIIEKAQPIVEEYGTAEQQGKFFQAVIARDGKRNRYTGSEQSLLYRRNALAKVLQTDNKDLIGFAHFILGNGLMFSNQLDEAEEQMRTAMKLAEQIGSTPLLVRCLTFLPIILRRRGQVEEVRSVITRALAMPEARNIAIIKGNRAWIAWRDGNMVEAEAYGRASLEERQDRQPANAFRWVGLWPLIGVMLAQEKLAEAMNYAGMLLDATQQSPSEQLSALLESALRAWKAGQQEEACALLQQAVPLAEKMGYL